MLLCHGVSRLQGWKAEFEVTYGCLDVGDFFSQLLCRFHHWFRPTKMVGIGYRQIEAKIRY